MEYLSYNNGEWTYCFPCSADVCAQALDVGLMVSDETNGPMRWC